jgi:hypothetical protein
MGFDALNHPSMCLLETGICCSASSGSDHAAVCGGHPSSGCDAGADIVQRSVGACVPLLLRLLELFQNWRRRPIFGYQHPVALSPMVTARRARDGKGASSYPRVVKLKIPIDRPR